MTRALSSGEVSQFVGGGAVRLRGAFSRRLAKQCRQLLWRACGCDEHDASTWTRPVIRIPFRGDEPFAEAINTARLRSAFDQLSGPGRWVARSGIGTFAIRFPIEEAPDDTGWHIEATATSESGTAVVERSSLVRVLFLLMLFSDVGPDDAPTRLRLGSHLCAARALWGSDGPVDFHEIARRLEVETEHLDETAAVGEAGDVWLCHPFVVHAAQRHRGTQVRFIAQPPLASTVAIDPARNEADRSPVEEAVSRALSS